MDNREIRNLMHPAPTTPEPTYSTQDVADLLGVHYKTVYAWVKQGLLTTSYNPGRRNPRFTQADIDNRRPPRPARRPRKEEQVYENLSPYPAFEDLDEDAQETLIEAYDPLLDHLKK